MRVFEGIDVGETKGNRAKRGGKGMRMLRDAAVRIYGWYRQIKRQREG